MGQICSAGAMDLFPECLDTLCGSRKYPCPHHGGNWKFQRGGGQRPRKFRRGGGVVSEFTFPDGHVRCHANLFQNCFLPTLKIFYIEKIGALVFNR